VIPADLLDRTWAYLHEESGAALTAHLDPGGHGLSASTVTTLSDWLDGTL
jgi:phospholipase/carboxylesterase